MREDISVIEKEYMYLTIEVLFLFFFSCMMM